MAQAPAFAAVLPAVDSQKPVALAEPGDVSATSAALPLTHHLDLAKDGAWFDHLARDIAASADRSGQLRFALAPEHLGRLEVALAQGADGTAIRLTADTREAHRIVAEAQPRLMAEARAQGLTISETSVDLNQSGGGGAQPQAFGNQNARGEGQPRTASQPLPPPAPAVASEEGAGDDELYA